MVQVRLLQACLPEPCSQSRAYVSPLSGRLGAGNGAGQACADGACSPDAHLASHSGITDSPRARSKALVFAESYSPCAQDVHNAIDEFRPEVLEALQRRAASVSPNQNVAQCLVWELWYDMVGWSLRTAAAVARWDRAV